MRAIVAGEAGVPIAGVEGGAADKADGAGVADKSDIYSLHLSIVFQALESLIGQRR